MADHDRFAALEARLAFLDDKEKIREALSRYSFNVDLGATMNISRDGTTTRFSI